MNWPLFLDILLVLLYMHLFLSLRQHRLVTAALGLAINTSMQKVYESLVQVSDEIITLQQAELEREQDDPV